MWVVVGFGGYVSGPVVRMAAKMGIPTKLSGIKKEDIVGSRRTKEVAAARHIAIYLVRTITEMSLPNIGKIFNRDHSTVMASIDLVEKKMITDPIVRLDIEQMTEEVTGSK